MELQSDEEIIYEGHPSWRSTLSFYIGGLLFAGAAAVIAYAINGYGIGGAALAVFLLLVLVVGWLRRVSTRYLITSHRMQIRRGLIARRVEETRVDRILDVTVHQSIVQRMLGIGTVDFDNASAQQGDLFRFAGIEGPEEVVRAVDGVLGRVGAPQRQVAG